MNITLIVGLIVGALFAAPLAWIGGDFFGSIETKRQVELQEALSDAEAALEAKQQDLDAQRDAAMQAAAAARQSEEQAQAAKEEINEYASKHPPVEACRVDDDLAERARRLLDAPQAGHHPAKPPRR